MRGAERASVTYARRLGVHLFQVDEEISSAPRGDPEAHDRMARDRDGRGQGRCGVEIPLASLDGKILGTRSASVDHRGAGATHGRVSTSRIAPFAATLRSEPAVRRRSSRRPLFLRQRPLACGAPAFPIRYTGQGRLS